VYSSGGPLVSTARLTEVTACGQLSSSLKPASASRQSGEWNDDDFDVPADGGQIKTPLLAPCIFVFLCDLSHSQGNPIPCQDEPQRGVWPPPHGWPRWKTHCLICSMC